LTRVWGAGDAMMELTHGHLAAVPRTDVREDKELSQVDMAGCPQ
jgi:hypothetical protein